MDIYANLLSGLEARLQRLERPPVVTLTTDFGLHDGYVGAMKGVIHTLLPDAKVVDISHNVTAHQINEGAFILYRAYRYFPADAVHVAVVDPGVGSERRPIVLHTRHGIFVGPDNGIFTYVLRAEQQPPGAGSERAPAWAGGMWSIAPNWAGEGSNPQPGDEEAYLHDRPLAFHLDNPDYWLPSVSNTFHGRDVFAPVAAHLASGAQPDRMGSPITLDSLVSLPVGAPRVQKTRTGTAITGQIVYLDHFGNIITNLPERLLAPMLDSLGSMPSIEIAGQTIKGLARSYTDVREGQPLALIGSERLLEIAVRNASAAQRLKVSVGDAVRIMVKDTTPVT